MLVFLRPWRHFGDLRQLLAVAGAGAQGQGGAARRVPLLCRSDPDGGVAHPRIRLGDGAAISRPARSSSRRQCRQSDRPHRGALLRDGRRLPEAHRHRRRDQADAGSGARRHEGRRAGHLGVAQPGPLRSAGRAHPGLVGRRKGNLRARRRVARTRHRHHPIRRRQRRRNEERADEPAQRGDRPPVVYNNLGQSMRRPGQWQKQMAQVDATTAKGIRAFPMCTPTASPIISRCANARRSAGCRPGIRSVVLARGDAARLQRPGGAQEAACRSGRVQGRHPAARDLHHLVGLYGPADCGAAEEQAL